MATAKKTAAKPAAKKARTVKTEAEKIEELLKKVEALKAQQKRKEEEAAAANKQLDAKQVEAFAAQVTKAASTAGFSFDMFLEKFIAAHYQGKAKLAKTRAKRKAA